MRKGTHLVKCSICGFEGLAIIGRHGTPTFVQYHKAQNEHPQQSAGVTCAGYFSHDHEIVREV
jgi:hypothetical protein